MYRGRDPRQGQAARIARGQDVTGEPPQGSNWGFAVLTAALLIGLVGQGMLLPCLCAIGDAKMTVALVFDGLVLVRMLAARWLKERNRGWMFYAILCCTSGIWIELLSWLSLGRHY